MIGQREIWEYLIYKYIASLVSLTISICHKQDKRIKKAKNINVVQT
jgi:hypothetical protein